MDHAKVREIPCKEPILQTLDQWQSWKKNREEQITFAMQCMTHFDKSDKDKEQQKHFKISKYQKGEIFQEKSGCHKAK